MYFPLLESLLQKNLEAGREHLSRFLHTETDRSALFKCLLTYSAQHDASDTEFPDAVVVSNNVIKTLSHSSFSGGETERLLDHVLQFLIAIPTESVDTTLLKPDRHTARVVSIGDLSEAFEQNDLDVLFGTVRDLLSLMDNKQYFLELIAHVALAKSPSSILVMQSIIEAMELMEWTNHFTPFLIYHLIKKLFLDKNAAPMTDEPISFSDAAEQVRTLESLQLFSSLEILYHFSKIAANKIHPRILSRLNIINSAYGNTPFDLMNHSDKWMDHAALRAAVSSLSKYPSLHSQIAKIPFKI